MTEADKRFAVEHVPALSELPRVERFKQRIEKSGNECKDREVSEVSSGVRSESSVSRVSSRLIEMAEHARDTGSFNNAR